MHACTRAALSYRSIVFKSLRVTTGDAQCSARASCASPAAPAPLPSLKFACNAHWPRDTFSLIALYIHLIILFWKKLTKYYLFTLFKILCYK